MAILIGTMLPFLVGLIVLYSYLGKKSESQNEEEKKTIFTATDEEDATELTKLMTVKEKNVED